MQRLLVQLTLLKLTVQRSLRDRVLDLASSVAFYTFFGIFPLLLLIVAGASFVLGSEQVQPQLYRLVEDTFPASGDLVQEIVQAVVRERGRNGLAGLAGLLWSASAALGAATRAINQVHGNPKPRSFLRARLRYLFTAVLVFTLAVTSVTVASVVELLITTERGRSVLPGFENTAGVWILGWIMSFAAMFVVFAILYKEAPAPPMRWRTVWPGALLATTITEIGKIGFLGYLERVANLEAVFGPLTSIMVLLLWLFLACTALMVGAEYNVVVSESQAAERQQAEAPASHRKSTA